MPYYPLSQILPNLYTNGGEYKRKDTRKIYVGYYHEVSNGQKFTGKIPTITSIEILEINPVNSKIQDLTGYTSNLQGQSITVLNDRYPISDSEIIINPKTNQPYPLPDSKYISNSQPRVIPSPYTSYPTKENKLNGVFSRYFCKKNNELKYFEIDKPTFEALSNNQSSIASDLYTGGSLTWKIKGNKEKVYIYNKNQSKNVEKKYRFPGFSQYFKDNFTQFHIESTTQENLYTNGGEFKTPNGREYIGPYHIHPENGAMVGATHVKKKHDSLTPINPQISSPVTSSQPLPQRPSTPSIGGGGYSGGGY